MMADSARHSSVDEDDVYDIPPSRQSFAFPDERKLEIPPSLPPKKHPNRSSIQDALGLSRAAQEPRPTPKPRAQKELARPVTSMSISWMMSSSTQCPKEK